MAIIIYMFSIMLVSISCLAGLGLGAASVPSDPESFARVKQPDCDCLETKYFKSQNSAAFSTAETDCKNMFKDAHLVYVGKPHEISNLTDFLDNNDSGTYYWAGAEYNMNNDKFEWGNGDIFDESGWAPGHRPSRNVASKVQLRYIDKVGFQFSTAGSTESRRYICEYQE